MNTMALRSLSKINNSALQNSRRLFSFKFEMTPRVAQESTATATEEAATQPSSGEELQTSSSFRYNVCQPRTSPVDKPSTAGNVLAARKQMVQSAIEQQHLQPAMMPEYYQKKMEKSAFINTDPEPSEKDKAVSQRKFQVSKTHANAIFPLKSVKLAPPFPEPVKMMMSRTVSDEEKAEQMLAESRSQRNFSDWGKTPTGQRNIYSGARRWFSSKSVGTDPEKCKKKGKKKEPRCPKMFLQNCPPRARTTCDREARIIHCKKQESPYPAYSEFCHEDIDEKPSECKICPWAPEDHPTFKPPKKHYHTSTTLDFKKTGLLVDETVKKVEEDIVPTPQESGDFINEAEELEEGMLCDLRKPACERPNNRRCPPPKKKKEEGGKAKKKAPKKKASSEDIDEILDDFERPRSVLSLKGQSKKGECKIRKFKFPECGREQARPKIEKQTGRCPTKPKKKKIIDCPAEDPNEKCAKDMEVPEEEYMILKDSKRIQKDNRRCPKVDLTINKKKEEEDDDPCKLKKTGTTKICPGDLLEKKRRKPRKKTSGMITPPFEDAPKKEQPQPQLTVKPPV